jgi:hypothetical protein
MTDHNLYQRLAAVCDDIEAKNNLKEPLLL